MTQYDMAHASLMTAALQDAIGEGRWNPDRRTTQIVSRMETIVAMQAEDADQIAIKDAYVFASASDLFVIAQGAWLTGTLTPTSADDRLFSPSRPPLEDPVTNVVEIDFHRQAPRVLPRAA